MALARYIPKYGNKYKLSTGNEMHSSVDNAKAFINITAFDETGFSILCFFFPLVCMNQSTRKILCFRSCFDSNNLYPIRSVIEWQYELNLLRPWQKKLKCLACPSWKISSFLWFHEIHSICHQLLVSVLFGLPVAYSSSSFIRSGWVGIMQMTSCIFNRVNRFILAYLWSGLSAG